MKVILLENVSKVGSIGEIIDVKRGFARNFLISKKKALFASKENIKEVEKIRQDLSKKDQDKKKDAKLIKEISYSDVINQNLRVMDLTAISLAKESAIPIYITNIFEENSLIRALKEEGNYSKIN